MKMNILVGAAALFAIVLMTVPAIATTGTVTATGCVTDERSNPVQGATVTLIDDNFRELGTTTSDASGNFKFQDAGLASSPDVKVKISYSHNGTIYNSSLSDMQWYDASTGLVSFSLNDTRLYHYPESDHGYVWGPILDSLNNGRTLDGTVYLVNDTTTLTAETSPNGDYQLEAAVGDYEIYAVHKEGSYWFVSNRTKITIAPSYSLRDSDPLMLVADVVTTVPPASPTRSRRLINSQHLAR